MLWITGTPTDLRKGLTRRDWLRVGFGGALAPMFTGHAPRIAGEVVPPSAEDFPHFGSALTHLRPAPRGVPTSVSLPWTIATSSSVQPGQGAGFLGRGYDPLRLHQGLAEVLDFT